MKRNLTMSLNEDLLKKSRKIAIEKNTTVSSLIRNYLQQLTEKEEYRKEETIRELELLFNQSEAEDRAFIVIPATQ